jgi:outer membrane protein assembly factor BamB
MFQLVSRSRDPRRQAPPPGVEELERRDCPSGSGDWPMYNHDPSGSRVNPDESVLSPAAVRRSGLAVRWRFNTPGAVSGTPAVVHGVVYDGDLDGNFLVNGTVFALDERSGAVLAKVVTAGSSSGPAVSHGRLYEGTGFAFGVNLINETNVSGSIVAVGLHVSGPAVDAGTRLAEQQNQSDILRALSLNGG